MHRIDNISSHLQDNNYVRVERRGVVGLIRLLRTAPPRSQVGGCVLCAPMRAQILRALKSLEADPTCLVIVFASTSDHFFSSGINTANFADGFISQPAQQPPVPSMFELTASVESCPKVCIAAIQGKCFSWGLELALAADYRVCGINARFRFPEVELGITPCGGGARRLVCRVGVRHALDMLCYGRLVYAREALKMGLLDAAPCCSPQLWEALAHFITTHVAASATDGLRTLDDARAAKAVARQRRRSCPAYAQLPFFSRGWYAWTEHKLRDSVPRARRAPYRAIDAVRLAVTHSLLGDKTISGNAAAADTVGTDAAESNAAYAAAERQLFEVCLASSEAQASQHLLRAAQRTSRAWEKTDALTPTALRPPVSSLPPSVDVVATTTTTTTSAAHVDERAEECGLGLRKVAVMGAGRQGASIALLLLWQRDIEQVVLIESDAQLQGQAVRAMEAFLRGRVAAHRLSQHRCEDMLRRLRATGDPNTPFPPLLADMDLVLECAPEVLALKQNIFAHLDNMCKRSTIFVSVSSSQDVNDVAAVTRRPGQVVGISFFGPADHSPVVEVMRGAATEGWVVERLMRLLSQLNRYPIVSRSGHGCVGTRLLLAALYQAYTMLEDGCLPMQIDFALQKTFNFTQGLFELEDIIGLDTTAAVRASMRRGSAGSVSAAAAVVSATFSEGQEVPVRVPSAEELSNNWWLPSRPVFDIPNSMIAVGAVGRSTREGWYTYATPEECTFGYAIRHPIKSWLWLPTTSASLKLNSMASVAAADAAATTTMTTAHHAGTTIGATAGAQSLASSCVPQRCQLPPVSVECVRPQHNYASEYLTLHSSKRHRCTRRPFRDEEIVDRIVFAMVNEAAKLMADGVITSSSDIDCISVYAFGFPAWRGGLCYYADSVAGLERVVYKMKVVHRALGSAEYPFPCTALQEMLARKQTFASISTQNE
ncbi:putative mitochondrial enoyl-CoA hydratase/Enoyl-CoA isomerase [Leptomonas pyrrhocoris]|uniref:Putative mitochondrial enoyl-CoA hydratase/Enoyl-CoA isomerase n=1 Tax=Leptomonas pyrrhocoris TaxID=157538 RepID=A0A0M9G7L6_LEPPY|nr:putative mitochondrial enoyl-CoA hydratase/Enoyl-CoA isomerase [Leptomonas pyrrhocoris]XP_015662770.1 putative mitochondrial enoyl-CoA hydratase/Enoyl-CoA isomerase [Leptomonas pyrrhocoris]XP_015662771.1 putative mitochondrial enoyl-CoA hydratase/Enoyl-CoA isomerase [Leptomonas pyrrhocoris]XP_015662772.1 putative mitochondrial enoyl-CoA hydratase/Enoyl-CoA isomerase [Leptomonas pyrrhocoris]KPA84330.1 putative mitochondrial enoyl-CoA hydratase/Enoyl-CoA isomerase [Leptomonas pyrrhocoris]KPA8|eukprot:XP_015662769.1 putative mitochondrial enoyl-CoA hydratase/Enoyl-CoA isomerase [Leptomonas pyrrhocoris]